MLKYFAKKRSNLLFEKKLYDGGIVYKDLLKLIYKTFKYYFFFISKYLILGANIFMNMSVITIFPIFRLILMSLDMYPVSVELLYEPLKIGTILFNSYISLYAYKVSEQKKLMALMEMYDERISYMKSRYEVVELNPYDLGFDYDAELSAEELMNADTFNNTMNESFDLVQSGNKALEIGDKEEYIKCVLAYINNLSVIYGQHKLDNLLEEIKEDKNLLKTYLPHVDWTFISVDDIYARLFVNENEKTSEYVRKREQ